MPAQSKQQQKFMGIVRAIQKGEQPASKFSKKAQDAADDMKKKDVEKFASTKHKGLPKKVEQELREKIRAMVEDYVETCGYRFSATNPEYKLKSPGGTGEEDRELKEEGFGGELSKTEKKKFNKERLENAEVLGYELTGTKDIKEGFASDAQRRAAFASGYKAKGKKKKKNETINEDGHTDVPSVVRKLKTSIEDSLQILGYLKKINDAEPLPSWWTDKVTLSANYLNSARDYILNPHESINEMSDKSKKVINKLGKKEKEVFLTMVDMLGFDQVMSDYKRDKKAFKQALKDMTESVFAVRQDKIKDDERYAKKPNFDYDPEKGKSRIRKVNESMSPSAIKKMRDDFEKTGELPPHLKKFAKDLKIIKKKHKVKNIVVPGLEWMSDMKEQSVNEARLNPKETIQQLGGNRFLYMVGAKNLAVDKPRNELHMKIMRNAKGVSHVVIKLTSLDLYDMKFLSIRAGKIRVKATEKGVYGDQLATFFKKHTGLNTRL